MTAALIVVEVCALALLGVLVAGLLRNQRRILVALGDLEARAASSTASDVELVGTALDGRPLVVRLAGAGDRTLLAFLSSSCITCRGLWAELADDLTASLPPGTDVLIVTEDGADERAVAVRGLAPRGVPLVMSSATWRRYGVSAAPYFALVDGSSGRVVAAGTAANGAEVLRLVQAAVGT
jgi:hypothetical protein